MFPQTAYFWKENVILEETKEKVYFLHPIYNFLHMAGMNMQFMLWNKIFFVKYVSLNKLIKVLRAVRVNYLTGGQSHKLLTKTKVCHLHCNTFFIDL